MKRILLAITIAVFIIVGFVVYRQFSSPQEGVAAQNSEETPVVAAASEISAEAQVVPKHFMTLAPAVGGRVATLLVQEGETVRTGDPLLRLESTELENKLRQSETAVTQAIAAVAQAKAGLAAAQAQLEAAVASVDAAEIGVDAAQAQQGLHEAQPEADDSEVAEAQNRIVEISIEQAEAIVMQAETGVNQAQVEVARAEAALEMTQAGLEQVKIVQEAAEAALAQLTLNAWFDGEVADILVKEGQLISPQTSAIILADFSEWLVETTDLTELDVVEVAVGAPVEVKIDALPDVTIAGTILDIDRISSLTRGDVTYRVTIRLDETAAQLPLRWGMTAFVNIDKD